jgi:trk system potassium uptake protein TrkA
MEALDLALVGGGDAQIIEVRAKRGGRLVGRPLKKVDFPSNSIVAAIIRKEGALLPRGETELREDDRLIIVALTESVPRLEKLLRESDGK